MSKAILVVSFGTTHPDTLEKTICAIEGDLAAAFPERKLYRAFTSGMVIRRLRGSAGMQIDTPAEALTRMLSDGVTDVLVQPTHIINGEEYETLVSAVEEYRAKFAHIRLGTPLLTGLADYLQLASILAEEIPEEPGTACVLMGHGSSHYANSAYTQLEYALHDLGRQDILIGTVEGYPGPDEILRRLKERNIRTVELRPLLIVAGDHAKNDMSGGAPDSWRSRIAAAGYEVRCLLKGLGEYPAVRAMFAAHAG